ncbi:MAG: zf-HC2 domain-containing protein [Acidobacteria bacterium]|nr:zf-HC2 domain-containing protein [Acidobacteriota bacterium]
MDCRAITGGLSDYLDGWMSADDTRSFESHLANCPRCRILQVELTEMRTAARELPLHTPSKAMWARISNEIEADLAAERMPNRRPVEAGSWWEGLKSRQFTFSLPQLAGAGALAAAVAIFGYTSLNSQNSGKLSLAGAQTAVLQGEDELLEELQRRLTTINARKASWDPQYRTDFDNQMNRIEQSLVKCRKKLNDQPGDKVHQEMVRSLYKEKLQLLNDIERLKW